MSIENQQERPNDGYEKGHRRMRELLGDAYSQERIDAIIAGNMDFDKILAEIEKIPSTTDPVQRKDNIDSWYKSHQEELDMFGK